MDPVARLDEPTIEANVLRPAFETVVGILESRADRESARCVADWASAPIPYCKPVKTFPNTPLYSPEAWKEMGCADWAASPLDSIPVSASVRKSAMSMLSAYILARGNPGTRHDPIHV